MPNPAESLRTFIAIRLSEEVRNSAGALINELKSSGVPVKWVHPENLHLTLKFLGPTEGFRIEQIRQALSSAAEGHTPFDLAFSGAGFFGSSRHPRVIWIALSDTPGYQALLNIQSDVERTVTPLGFESEDRPYKPHLTIGRVRQERQQGKRSFEGLDALVRSLQGNQERAFGASRITAIDLMKSELTPSGARYERLMSIPLK